MELQPYYQAPTKENWQGRADALPHSVFFQCIQLIDLCSLPTLTFKPTTFALIGFCCDEGVRRNSGRLGAAMGPQAIRRALAKLPLHAPQIALYDAGDIICRQQDLESAQQALGVAVALLIARGIVPIVLGGGHELAYGHYQGIAKALAKERLTIINCDAHFDMRPLLPNRQGSSGTPFLQIAKAREAASLPFFYHCLGIQPTGNTADLFATAKKYHVNTLLAETIHQQSREQTASFLQAILDQAQHIYLTLCLDVFASSVAPGVSAPQTYGLTLPQVSAMLKQIAQSGKVVSYDIAELSPILDHDHRTAKLAAHLVFDIIHQHKFNE